MNAAVQALRERLESYLSSAAGAPARIASVLPLAGGASRECWAVDVEISSGPDAGRHGLVLRRDAGGVLSEESLTREEEFQVLCAAHAEGVRAPRPRWCGTDPALLGGPFFLMERLPGEAVGRRIARDPALAQARGGLAAEMGQELARIHAIDPGRHPLDFLPHPEPGLSPARTTLEHLAQGLWQRGEPHPVLELALRWLTEHAPECESPVLVHGDFRLGNVLVRPEGLAGVLDWEFAHLGDPHEDLAWPLVRSWRFGAETLRFGGISAPEPFLEAYEAASGRRVDPAALAYWEVMGNFRWAVGCLVQADRHLRGLARSVELASLGRKAAEVEWELLELICTADRPRPS
jgi:aminoglycoside phosphotransferase (APT) family kinase protein